MQTLSRYIRGILKGKTSRTDSLIRMRFIRFDGSTLSKTKHPEADLLQLASPAAVGIHSTVLFCSGRYQSSFRRLVLGARAARKRRVRKGPRSRPLIFNFSVFRSIRLERWIIGSRPPWAHIRNGCVDSTLFAE